MLNLIPQPRQVTVGDGRARADLQGLTSDKTLPAQGYRLELSTEGALITASDPAGEAYARATLDQIRDVYGADVPEAVIVDWPDFPSRGVMLDVSRDKVPTMDTLKRIVDQMAALKLNELQLYIEHTFAYRGHETVWAKASPYTAEDLTELAKYCAKRFVTLVPHQNSFGHFERWLCHPEYFKYAALPEGLRHPAGSAITGPSTTLDPCNPESATLIEGLLEQMLASVPGDTVHIGCDEPFDLNVEFLAAWFKDLGSGTQEHGTYQLTQERLADYGKFVSTIASSEAVRDREVLIWGDVCAAHPELLADLPEHITVCEWGYAAEHPFDRTTRQLADRGRAFRVCPGTSSWCAPLGEPDTAFANLLNAAEAGIKNGAAGYLNTDWGNHGHFHYWSISQPAIAYGAAVSWCVESNRDIDIDEAVNVHVFRDRSRRLAGILRRLGNAHTTLRPRLGTSMLTVPLLWPRRVVELVDSYASGELTDSALAAVESVLADESSALDSTDPAVPEGHLILREVRNAANLHLLLARDLRDRLRGDGTIGGMPWPARVKLATALEDVLTTHRELWLLRNRPGGLNDSAAWLERLLRDYRESRLM